jgi:hypothetical protein
MEEGGRPDEVRMVLEEAALVGLDSFKVVQRGETAIDQRPVGQGPEVFGGLQLRRIGRQETQMETRGQQDLGTGVPAGTIQDEKDVFARTGADEAGEFAQGDLESGERDGGQDQEEGAPGAGMHKAIHVGPLVAGMDQHGRALSALRPNAPQDRLQANAMFIHAPEFDLVGWQEVMHRPHQLRQAFF